MSGYVTIEGAAAAFGVSVVTMRHWIGRGAPVVRRGRCGMPYQLDVGAVRRWRQAWIEEMSKKRAPAQRELKLGGIDG